MVTGKPWRVSGYKATIQLVTAVLALTALCLPSGAAPAASIRIRFLDPTSGKPIRKMWVAVSQYKDKPAAGPVPAGYRVAFTSVKTDRNGEVVVQLLDPTPAFISVDADLWYNASFIAADEVLKSGVVLDYSHKPPPKGCWVDKDGHCRMKSGSLLPDEGSRKPPVVNPKPQPGLLIIVEKRISRWERLRQELP
jgi:hypothetical protein